jgi:hypothetical protein
MDLETRSRSLPLFSKMTNKKVPFLTGLHFVYIFNILQQSRTSLKKEVKIETIVEILLSHNT